MSSAGMTSDDLYDIYVNCAILIWMTDNRYRENTDISVVWWGAEKRLDRHCNVLLWKGHHWGGPFQDFQVVVLTHALATCWTRWDVLFKSRCQYLGLSSQSHGAIIQNTSQSSCRCVRRGISFIILSGDVDLVNQTLPIERLLRDSWMLFLTWIS